MEPSNNGTPAAPTAGEPAAPIAPTVNEPVVPTAADPAQGGEPDYKAQNEKLKADLESEKQRRAGLDKKLSQLRKGSRQEGIDPNLPEDQRDKAELDNLRIFKAEVKLKESAQEILDRYPEVPKAIAKQIVKNPRGYINANTSTVEDAELDLEEYVAGVAEDFRTSAPGDDPKKVAVSGPNATVNAPGKPDLNNMTPDQVDEAIASGKLTEQDLEDHVKAMSAARRNSK